MPSYPIVSSTFEVSWQLEVAGSYPSATLSLRIEEPTAVPHGQLDGSFLQASDGVCFELPASAF